MVKKYKDLVDEFIYGLCELHAIKSLGKHNIKQLDEYANIIFEDVCNISNPTTSTESKLALIRKKMLAKENMSLVTSGITKNKQLREISAAGPSKGTYATLTNMYSKFMSPVAAFQSYMSTENQLAVCRNLKDKALYECQSKIYQRLLTDSQKMQKMCSKETDPTKCLKQVNNAIFDIEQKLNFAKLKYDEFVQMEQVQQQQAAQQAALKQQEMAQKQMTTMQKQTQATPIQPQPMPTQYESLGFGASKRRKKFGKAEIVYEDGSEYTDDPAIAQQQAAYEAQLAQQQYGSVPLETAKAMALGAAPDYIPGGQYIRQYQDIAGLQQNLGAMVNSGTTANLPGDLAKGAAIGYGATKAATKTAELAGRAAVSGLAKVGATGLINNAVGNYALGAAINPIAGMAATAATKAAVNIMSQSRIDICDRNFTGYRIYQCRIDTMKAAVKELTTLLQQCGSDPVCAQRVNKQIAKAQKMMIQDKTKLQDEKFKMQKRGKLE